MQHTIKRLINVNYQLKKHDRLNYLVTSLINNIKKEEQKRKVRKIKNEVLSGTYYLQDGSTMAEKLLEYFQLFYSYD